MQLKCGRINLWSSENERKTNECGWWKLKIARRAEHFNWQEYTWGPKISDDCVCIYVHYQCTIHILHELQFHGFVEINVCVGSNMWQCLCLCHDRTAHWYVYVCMNIPESAPSFKSMQVAFFALFSIISSHRLTVRLWFEVCYMHIQLVWLNSAIHWPAIAIHPIEPSIQPVSQPANQLNRSLKDVYIDRQRRCTKMCLYFLACNCCVGYMHLCIDYIDL